MKVSDIKTIGIIGAGVMGPGIAEIFAIFGAVHDFKIILYDISKNALNNANMRLKADIIRISSTGLYSQEDLNRARQRINTTNDYTSLQESQLIIEAVPEDLELKCKVFNSLDDLMPSSTIFTTNSSGLSVTKIAKATNRPNLVIGTHFMNPPILMPLVEVVKGETTSNDTVEVVMRLLSDVNKRPVLVQKDIPGYVHNRLQAAVFRELMFLLENEIMSKDDLETTVRYGLGLRLPVMKAFEMVDLMGLDTISKVLTYLYPELNQSIEPPSFLEKMIKEGRLGVKTGLGFHNYKNKDIEESMNQKQAATFQLLMMMQQFD